MKKNYLLSFITVAVAMSNTMWAQRVKPLTAKPFGVTLQTAPTNNDNLPATLNSSADRAYGSVLWSQDFGTAVTGGVPTGWTQAGANQVWKKTFEGSSGQYSSKTATINSTTKTNGVLIYDADSVTTKAGSNTTTAGSIMSEVINLTGKPNVILQFQQYFRLCCNTGTTTITASVSKDGGTTWTDYDCRGAVALNNFPPNPQLMEFNISAATLSSNNVRVKFSFTSETGTYFWQVDDVKILEGPNNDIKIDSSYVDFGYDDGGYYTQIPFGQAPDMGFRAIVKNVGGLTQKNIKLNAVVNNGTSVYNKTSAAIAVLPVSARDTLKLLVSGGTTKYTPGTNAAAMGTYTTTFTISQDSVDQNASNNLFTRAFTISDTTFARDNGVLSGGTVGSLGPNNYVNGKSDAAVIASLYEFTSTAKINTVSAYVATASSVGASFEFVLYSNDLVTELAVSDIYTITAAADKGKWVTMKFQTGVYTASAGDGLYIGMRCYGGSSTPSLSVYTLNDLSKLDIQRANGSTVFYLPLASPPDWYNVGASSPYIRLGLVQKDIGIEEFEAKNGLTLYQNVPNPAKSSTVIKYNVEKNSEVKLSVYDVAGRKLLDKNEGTAVAGEHSINVDLTSFSKGVYFYTLTANGHSLTKKMVITE